MLTTMKPARSWQRCAAHSRSRISSPTTPNDHRFVTVDPTTGAECTVEMFADGGRLHDRVTLDIGPVLHPDDLAADTMLALWGRARPRDFFDVAALIDRYGHDRLLELAEEGQRVYPRDIYRRPPRHRTTQQCRLGRRWDQQ